MPSANSGHRGRTTTSKSNSRRRFIKYLGSTGIAAGLAGCTSSPGGDDGSDETSSPVGTVGDEEVTVTWSNSLSGDIWTEYEQSLYDSGLSDNITIKNQGLPEQSLTGTWDQWFETEQKEPDIVMLSAGFGNIQRYIQNDHLVNLNQNMDQGILQNEVLDGMPEVILRPYMDDQENLYGVPFFLDVGSVHYRKDLVEQAGYDPEGENWATDPPTWKQFSKVVKDAQDESGTKYGFGWPNDDIYTSMIFLERLSTWGSNFFGDVPFDQKVGERPVTVDEQEGVDTVRMNRSFIYGQDDEHALEGFEQIAPSAVLQWGSDEIVGHMDSGNMVALRNWGWSLNRYGAEDAFGDDIGVMPMPYQVTEENARYAGNGGPRTTLGSWNMVVNAHSENVPAALEVLEAMVQDQAIVTLLRTQGYTPAKPSVYKSDLIEEAPPFDRYGDTLAYMANRPAGTLPMNPVWTKEQEFFQNHINAAYKQQKSPEKALTDLATQIEEYEESVKDQY